MEVVKPRKFMTKLSLLLALMYYQLIEEESSGLVFFFPNLKLNFGKQNWIRKTTTIHDKIVALLVVKQRPRFFPNLKLYFRNQNGSCKITKIHEKNCRSPCLGYFIFLHNTVVHIFRLLIHGCLSPQQSVSRVKISSRVIEGIDSKEITISKVFLLPSEKESTLKGKNSPPPPPLPFISQIFPFIRL